MSLIKEIVGCLNLIRLHVPLTDVIVLIGSFISFTHSTDGTMDMFLCLSCCLRSALCVCWELRPSFLLYYFMAAAVVCLCLSLSRSLGLWKK